MNGEEPDPTDLRAALAENWSHARHQEHQRELFARLYVVLVVAVFAYLKDNVAGNQNVVLILAALGCFGLLFTLKTNIEFDNHIKAIAKITDQLHLRGFMALPVVRSERHGWSRIVLHIVRVRYLYIALYAAIVVFCLMVYSRS